MSVSLQLSIITISAVTDMQAAAAAKNQVKPHEQARILCDKLQTLITAQWVPPTKAAAAPPVVVDKTDLNVLVLRNMPTLEECGGKWGIITRGKNLEVCAYLPREETCKEFENFFRRNGSKSAILDK